MKKLTLLVVLTITIAAFLTSCSSFTKVTDVKITEISGRSVIQKPVLVDLDVKITKVTATSTGILSKGTTVESVKAQAVADAVKQAGADVLVEPIFETTISGKRVTAIVTGFPATYKNFRSITAEDMPLLQTGTTQTVDVYQAPKTKTKKKLF
ncbi:MAG: hypothetical protein V1904_13705 [Bacteroidota bacterium]